MCSFPSWAIANQPRPTCADEPVGVVGIYFHHYVMNRWAELISFRFWTSPYSVDWDSPRAYYNQLYRSSLVAPQFARRPRLFRRIFYNTISATIFSWVVAENISEYWRSPEATSVPRPSTEAEVPGRTETSPEVTLSVSPEAAASPQCNGQRICLIRTDKT